MVGATTHALMGIATLFHLMYACQAWILNGVDTPVPYDRSKSKLVQRGASDRWAHLHPRRASSGFASFKSATAEADITGDASFLPPVYNGPIQSLDKMEAGTEIASLGLALMVGESVVAPGSLGLFCKVLDEGDSVSLPAFTPMAGYARGTFHREDTGDKTVAYVLNGPDTAVFFNQQLMPLREAVAAVSDATVDASDSVAGHTLMLETQLVKVGHNEQLSTLTNLGAPAADLRQGAVAAGTSTDATTQRINEGVGELVLVPECDDDDFPRYFVPDADGDRSVRAMGQYANDLAYQQGMGHVPHAQESYRSRAHEKNVVQLVWRLERSPERASKGVHGVQLVPTWPVTVLSRDITFENVEPMELGCTYGWAFWDAAMDEGAAVSAG
eukprot:TRINITY_DN1607_c0_g1_i3.p1 TRINITY_DN1607_c0_g1~~TRINITY_DN1607_c0_g1_i3.p1  ORF type:complete len:386 (+),score=91.17 TRINITY_DN1607_c0_g1_i3:50-1207(+)